ncbi:major facilitator superfamily transporter [Bifidobacterium criceti]|uniref:Major facilitator superfamily transporter n=2 Tax=Bifidobacterium criceti TaxID=1960969 RepID=A0A2A2EDS2_9BIFI|nr:major facilitator superfamily transporter [Bifidobacterium criceti]
MGTMAHEQTHAGVLRAGTPAATPQVILGFLAIGLPEALLGASWPAMGAGVGAPLVAVVGIAAVIAAGCAAAAIYAEPVVRRVGSGRTVDMGVALTVLALSGFSFAPHYWALLVFALPYGIGSGMLVVALNAYVAVRSANAHITWLHATSAFGALVGHTVLGWIIANGADWRWAYRTIGLVQLALAMVLAAGTRRWHDRLSPAQIARLGETPYAQGDWRHDMRRPHAVHALMAMPAAVAVLVLLFAATSVEQTTMLWASSYMVHAGGMSIHTAGVYANLFFVGLVAGSVVAGVVALRVRDVWMVAGGIAVLIGGVALMVVPVAGLWRALTAPVLLGVGCAPIAPAVVHAIPRLFGAASTPAMIGVQTAAVSMATLVSPVLFAWVERAAGSMHALPWYLLVFTVIALAAYACVLRVVRLHALGE